MNLQEINKQEIESRLEALLPKTKIENIEPESIKFTYNHYWDCVYVGLEFDSREPCFSLAEMNRVKRVYEKQGYKVSTINIYPINYNSLSFRICFEM